MKLIEYSVFIEASLSVDRLARALDSVLSDRYFVLYFHLLHSSVVITHGLLIQVYL